MKWLNTIVLVIALLGLGSCSGGHFRLKASIKGLGQQNVRVVYTAADGSIHDLWVMAQSDQFEVEGDCASPSLFMVFNSMNVPIFTTVVSNGDDVEVEGKVVSPNELKIGGSETAMKWAEFVAAHKSQYLTPGNPALNTAIEKYVKENPKSLVSTLLVLVDYTPASPDAVDKLLNSIDDSAKPAVLLQSYNTMKSRMPKAATTIKSLNLLELNSQDYEAAVFTGSKPSLVLFWDKPMGEQAHRAAIDEMKMIDAERVQLIDVNIDVDSMGWSGAIKRDATTWKHYWAPGAMMNSSLLDLRIISTPTIIVTDSTGRQLYRGDDPVKARQTVETL